MYVSAKEFNGIQRRRKFRTYLKMTIGSVLLALFFGVLGSYLTPETEMTKVDLQREVLHLQYELSNRNVPMPQVEYAERLETIDRVAEEEKTEQLATYLLGFFLIFELVGFLYIWLIRPMFKKH